MDVIPETIYGPYGYIDDIYISVFVLRKVAHELGYEFLQKLWEDDEDIENIIEICFKESVEVLAVLNKRSPFLPHYDPLL